MGTILEYVMLMNSKISNEVATGLIAICSSEFMMRTNQRVIPMAANGLVARMVIEKYNRLGVEGLSSHSLGAASETFNEDYSSDVLAGIYSFRKLNCV